MSDPTQEQQVAISLSTDGHSCVSAIPGSGKTYVIERRIDYMIHNGVAPENILVLTFSRSQADDMARRIFSTFPYLQETALADGLSGNSQVTTIHAACRRILAEDFSAFDVRNRAESWRERAIIEKWVEDNEWYWYNPYTREEELVGHHSVLYWINAAKREYIKWDVASLLRWFEGNVVLDGRVAPKLARCAVAYQEALRRAGRWTFADLLYQMEDRLTRDAAFRDKWKKRFTHFLIDEAQDTNRQAMRIVHLLEPVSVFIVGDEDQAIYSFNGATPEANLRDGFEEMYGGERVKITCNFRSVPTILRRAASLIEYNYDEESKKFMKTLVAREGLEPGPDLTWDWYEDPEQEAEAIVSHIGNLLDNKEAKPGDIFVMSRTNAQMAYFELELLHKDIPFVNLGHSSFFSRKIPDIIINYMRLAVDPGCWSAYDRIYNIASRHMRRRDGSYIPTRYLGHEFNGHLNRQAPSVVEEVNNKKFVKDRRNWARWEQGADDLVVTLRKLGSYSIEDSVVSFVQDLREYVLNAWMEHEYPVELDSSESAYEDLEVVTAIGARFTIGEFLAYIAQLQATKDVKPEDLVDYVLIGTIYRFKGLERDRVYVVGLTEGLLPHRFSLGAAIPTDGVPLPRTADERDERRLCFVAITRAKMWCHLSGVEQWPTISPTDYPLSPSRFVQEMGLVLSEG